MTDTNNKEETFESALKELWINSDKKFGDFTYGKASETLPICDECKTTRTKKINEKVK